jgi:predicted metalloprotease with PDZ domain
VEARFERAASDRLVAPEAGGAIREVTVVEGRGAHAAAREDGAWSVPACRDGCTIRYRVDLDALVASCRGMDCARRVGDAVIGSAAVWMLRPQPLGDALVRVRVDGDASRFVTGLRRDPRGGYVVHGHELGEAAYTAFGSFRRARVDVPGASLDVALLGAPLAMGDEAALHWVEAASSCVAGLFGRFPVTATVFVVPAQGADEVVFGRVLSMAGASVALLFGSATSPASMHDDWVVVHELFHLGTPTFVGEGHWLEEGLATYYEPILRERAGWMSEADLWKHFVKEMPRGLRKDGEPPSLEDRDDIDSTYWGGALFALLADVDVLRETGGARSLDDVVRAVLAREGDATHTARVADFLRVGDESTGTRALTGAYARYAVGGQTVDLDALWRSLGIVVGEGGSVTLRDDAPLAPLRRAIAAGGPH